MKDTTLAASLRAAHEHWERLKSRWYDLGLPFAHYASEVPALMLLALMQLPSDELIRRLNEAALQYKRQHDDPDSPLSMFSGDTVQLLMLAAMPAEPEVVVLPAAVEEPVVPEPEVVVEPAPLPPAVHDPAPVVAVPFTAPLHADESPSVEHLFVIAPPMEAATHEESVSAQEVPVDQDAERPCPHVGKDGKCLACTEDETGTCATCTSGEDDYPMAELVKCKDEDCGTSTARTAASRT